MLYKEVTDDSRQLGNVQPLERQRDNELSKSQARLKRQSFIIDNSRIICLLFFKTIEDGSVLK